MENKERNITPEEAVILWHVSRLDLSEDYEQAPEILKVRGSVIGTLGNFSASIGKAKSKKTFNVSAIVAAALKNGTVLNYTAELPENKRKILYVDTEQSMLVLVNYIAAPNARELSAKTKTRCEPLTDSN